MKLGLMVSNGSHAGQVISASGVCLMIGRDPQCHVRPDSPGVSPRHCQVVQRADRAFVRDLDSPSGTFLNERQLRGEIELRDGDFLQVGPIVFVVQLQAETHDLPPLESLSELATGGSSGSHPCGETQECPAESGALPEDALRTSATNGTVAPPRRTRATWVGSRRAPSVGRQASRQTLRRQPAGARGSSATMPLATFADVAKTALPREPLDALTARIDTLKEELTQTEPELDFDLLRAAGIVDDPTPSEDGPVPSDATVFAPTEAAEHVEPREVPSPVASPLGVAAETQPPPTDLADRQGPTEPPKQEKGKPRCPRCPSSGLLSWDNSVRCCTGCWTWYQIDSKGNATAVSPLANADQAVLRLRDASGQCRDVRVPPGIVKQRRREWADRHRWRLAGLFTIRQLVSTALLAGLVLSIFLVVRGRSASREAVPPRSQARTTKTVQKPLRNTTDERNGLP